MNQFETLDAQSEIGSLAQMTTEETETPIDTRPTCQIVPVDYGDDDRRDYWFEVWSENVKVCDAHANKIDAGYWATANGYRIAA